MTANAIKESEALTLDFNKLAKVAEVPGVLLCAAHIPHVPSLIAAGFPIAAWGVIWTCGATYRE